MRESYSSRLALVGSIACSACLLASVGCTYSLPAPSPPSQERVRVLAKSPESYILRLSSGRSLDFPVPQNGKVTLSIPPISRSCIVRFMGMRVSGGHESLNDWTISVNASGKSAKTLTLRQLAKLPTDSEGFRLLSLSEQEQ